MALGGGSFTSYNKVLPGTYTNFVSATGASSAVGERGICAVGIKLSWGKEGEMIKVTAGDFMKYSTKLFGYSYGADENAPLRDLFLNASVAYVYRLGTSIKAGCDLCEAKYGGKCGNKIKVRVTRNIDDETLFDVDTYYDGALKERQTVKSADELVDNDFAVWKKNGVLTVSVLNLTGGSDAEVKGEDYQKFLEASEAVKFNTMAVASTDETVNALVAAYTKRMREERGIKFQSVLYKCEADDIGVINVDTPANEFTKHNEADLVWFVAGATAGCAINKSLTNRVYNGSIATGYTYTQSELEEGIKSGKFIFHNVDGDVRVLADINSLVNVTSEIGEAFKENQTVRIIDQIAYDDAKLFKSKYLGVVPNDEAGRISLWNDIVEHRKSLAKMRAIESFKDEDIVVSKGSSKTSVVITSVICPINSMTQLYITTTVE